MDRRVQEHIRNMQFRAKVPNSKFYLSGFLSCGFKTLGPTVVEDLEIIPLFCALRAVCIQSLAIDIQLYTGELIEI